MYDDPWRIEINIRNERFRVKVMPVNNDVDFGSLEIQVDDAWIPVESEELRRLFWTDNLNRTRSIIRKTLAKKIDGPEKKG